ncbi:Putative metal chaperone [Mycobacterium marinum MB2]|nr:Putative metal chaperone [Mycobacterium marinum MB2]
MRLLHHSQRSADSAAQAAPPRRRGPDRGAPGALAGARTHLLGNQSRAGPGRARLPGRSGRPRRSDRRGGDVCGLGELAGAVSRRRGTSRRTDVRSGDSWSGRIRRRAGAQPPRPGHAGRVAAPGAAGEDHRRARPGRVGAGQPRRLLTQGAQRPSARFAVGRAASVGHRRWGRHRGVQRPPPVSAGAPA